MKLSKCAPNLLSDLLKNNWSLHDDIIADVIDLQISASTSRMELKFYLVLDLDKK